LDSMKPRFQRSNLWEEPTAAKIEIMAKKSLLAVIFAVFGLLVKVLQMTAIGQNSCVLKALKVPMLRSFNLKVSL
jgi:hypothetical protein